MYSVDKFGLSIAPGDQVELPVHLDLHTYSDYHIHYYVDATLDVAVSWKPSITGSFSTEKTVSVAASIFPMEELSLELPNHDL